MKLNARGGSVWLFLVSQLDRLFFRAQFYALCFVVCFFGKTHFVRFLFFYLNFALFDVVVGNCLSVSLAAAQRFFRRVAAC